MLLTTASVSGNSINIIRLEGKAHLEAGRKEGCVRGTNIYTLYRGHTSAVITGITFTSDSKWVAVSTAKGTTHLFAINPEGGDVNPRTHPPIGDHTPAAPPLKAQPLSVPNDIGPKVLYALNRLRLSYEGNDSADFSLFKCFFTPGNSRRVLQLTPNGILVQYQLQPIRSQDANEVAVLSLGIIPEQEWDLNRKLNMPVILADFSSSAGLLRIPPSPCSLSENFWASFSETCTYDLKLLEQKKVLISQRVLFHFQTYDEEEGEDLAQSVLTYPKPR